MNNQMDKQEIRTGTNYSKLVLGLIFVALAVLLIVDNFNICPIYWGRYIFTWQTLLIAIGLIILPNPGSRTTGLVLIAIGAFFLTAKFYHFPISIWKLFWPSIILLVGLSLIFSSRRSHWHPLRKGEVNDNLIDDVSIFGGSEQKFTSKQFRGGKITNIFGGSTIDLTDANLEPGLNLIEILCIFGGSKLIIPTSWRIKVEVTSIFGGVSDKRKIPSELPEDAPELVIRGLVLFGGLEFKSF